MKANSARDPYWLAKVRYEVARSGVGSAEVENTCLHCHAPAQQYAARENGTRLRVSDLNDTGRDGVTCTVCHQISPERLGTSESFTGRFSISSGEAIFGRHAEPFAMPMLHHTGYRPTEGRHMLQASLCGTCHTVISTAAGRADFVEQAPYLEWLASSYPRQGIACQTCHLPQMRTPDGELEPRFIAHRPPGGSFPPTSPRAPFGRHLFAGANVRGLEMLADGYPDQAERLRESAARSFEMLRTAVSLATEPNWLDDRVVVDVIVRNLTGHKLPTAYPSRRLWLHVTASDDRGIVWDSGGDITSNADVFEPHRTRIDNPKQTMIYEAEYLDIKGRSTASLTEAAAYRKDNRILPVGFSSMATLPKRIDLRSIAPVGTDRDKDFVAGSDRVTYDIATTRRPTRVTVEALYQSIKPEHAEAVDGKGSEGQRFLELYARHGAPVVVASVTVEAPTVKRSRNLSAGTAMSER